MKIKRCGKCGSKEIRAADVIGKSFPFRDFPAVMLVKSAKVAQCQNCGEMHLSMEDTKKLDVLLEEKKA